MDPIAYYLGAPTDLPPELVTLFQQTHKRAVPEGIERPRLTEQQRMDISLMAPSLLPEEISMARMAGESMNIPVMGGAMPTEDFGPMLPEPEPSALPPMPPSPFLPEQGIPPYSIEALSPQPVAIVPRK